MGGEWIARQRGSLVGETFGAWTVKERQGSLCGHARYVCVCRCGTERLLIATNLRQGCTKSCGCERTGPNGRKWRTGGRTPGGYIRLHRPDHPNSIKNGTVFEHVVVMTEILGRPLLQGENVHHRNGVRDDNRPENLELWVTMQPSGQRVSDLLAWAHEVIERYGDVACLT